jgi:phosphoenolpyruvate carboxylase
MFSVELLYGSLQVGKYARKIEKENISLPRNFKVTAAVYTV